jgi:uncharacterized protein YecT (DUF1311 family)
MLEEPRSKWERIAPFVAGGALLLVLAGAGVAALAPKFRLPERPAAAETNVAPNTAELVAETASADTAPQNTWIEWASDKPLNTYRVGGFDFSFRPIVDDGLNAARMRVATADGVSTELTGQALTWAARADFAVVQLDASKADRQVLFSSFSGGAHCCTSLTLLEIKDGAWRATDLGQRDGDAAQLPRDVDGDGLKEFIFGDQSFLYAFDSYAGSWAPTVVISVSDGRSRDVSAQARFRSVYQRELAEMREACGERANGACAAYVATAARVGQLDQAWAFMLRSYDQSSDWIYPSACRVRTAAQCPAEAELKFASFPESLQWFLGEQGYTAPSYVEPMQARGPSFSCGAARKASEQAICASSELSALDRLMARAYTRATALTAERGALRTSQREFLVARDQASDEYVLRDLYADRIRQLAAI